MKTLCITILFLMMLASVEAQVNTWIQLTQGPKGGRNLGALVYAPDSDRFVLSMGAMNDSAGYSEQMFSFGLDKWINFFPHDSLYGPWGDSTGKTQNLGRMGSPVFNSPYFIFKTFSFAGLSFLRPNLHHHRQSAIFQQYAFDPREAKTWFYAHGKTFSYDNRARRWDTVSAAMHPSVTPDNLTEAALRWGAMAYDPVNLEMVLLGGGGIAENKTGSCGTWTFSLSSRTWTKRTLSTEPEPRAYASMVTDPVRGKIVLFGGDHLDYLLNDTWVYDCATRTWEKKSPAVSPKPRAGQAMVYLPKTGTLVMLGGYEYTSCSSYTVCAPYRKLPQLEMWKYDLSGNSWSLIKVFATGEEQPALAVPENLKAAADSADRIVTITADSSWWLRCDPMQTDVAGTTARGVAPDLKEYRTGPWDPAYFDANLSAPDTAANEAFLRNIAPNTWTAVVAPKKPRGNHDWGTTIFDPDRSLFIKFTGGHSAHCGSEVDQYDVANNRWHISFPPEYPLEYTFDAGLPAFFTFNGHPFVTHSYANYDYDVNLKKMIYIKPRYTFFYDPDKLDWDTVQTKNPAAMTTDYHHIHVTNTPHGVMAWAGRSNSSSIYDLYLFEPDSMKWRLLPRTGAALPSSYGDNGGGAYDTKRDRLLMVHCASGTALPTIATYDFKTGVTTAHTPVNNAAFGSTRFREAVYVPSLDVVFFQALYGSLHLVWDCATDSWRTANIPKGAGVNDISSVSSGYGFDPKRNLIWNSPTNSDTYVLRLTADGLGLNRAETKPPSAPGLAASPNPFTPGARIVFELGSAERAVLSVYAPDGRKISSLLRGKELTAGLHGITWNGKDDAGLTVSTGFYIVRLVVNGRTLEHKILLCR